MLINSDLMRASTIKQALSIYTNSLFFLRNAKEKMADC